VAKKRKKNKNKLKGWEGAAFCPVTGRPLNGQGAQGGGLFAGLGRLLPAGRTEQFLLGAAVGAAAAYVLSDEDLREKLIHAGVKLYAGLAGGLEEFKEQVADARAEFDAGSSGSV